MSRSNWLEVLIDPSSVAGASDESAERRGLAYLFAGRLVEYLRFAEERNLPKPGEVAYERPRLDQAVLQSITLFLGGNDLGIQRLQELLAGRELDPQLRAVASVFVSIAYADAWRASEAIEILERARRRVRNNLVRAFLLVHLGVRLSEIGDIASALDRTLEATNLLETGTLSRSEQALAAVARSNALQFGLMARRPLAALPTRQLESPILSEIDAMQLDALRSYLDERFDRALSDPETVSISFKSQDLIDSRLWGALLRSEFLASWSETMASRRALARYRLLISIGIAESVPDAAFQLLRRAGDGSGLAAAVRTYLRFGPLQPVLRLVTQVATGPWLASAAGATTAVLHLAAELLAEPDADLAADRLIGKITFDLQNNLGYDLFRDMDALGAVMQLASPQRAAEILLRLMELVRGTRNSALLQGAARVTAVARWDALPDAAVDAWLEYVSQAIAPPTDAQLLAITTAGALARVRPAQVAEVARRAFASTPGLAVGALLVSLTSTSSTIDVAGVATVAREAIRALRAEAAAGKFGFGAVVDAPLLLASLLVEGRQQKGWSELISFLTDPRVAWHHKLRAYSYLADHVEAIPVTMRSRLAAATLPAADDARNLFVTGSQVVGAQLRMAVALGSRDDEYVLSGLLGMAVSERPGDRIEACRSLQFVLGRRQSDALITLALALSQDSHPEVRAAGGSALAASAVLGKGRLAPLALERVKTLLIEPGVAAPRAVLDGLISAKSRQEIEIDELRPILARLALHHPSAAVRFRAQGLLNPAISGAATPPVS